MQDFAFGYDLASNITSIGDNLNRLTSATGLYGTNTYAYDGVGNRTQRTVTVPFAGTETYTTQATSNRLTSISGAVNRGLTYEASGQALTDQRSPVDTWTYTTDKAGRMSEAKLNTVTQATFAYDADELRIAKTNATTSAITHYIYDADGQLLAEIDAATGNPIREYIWLGALPIGTVDRLGTSGASRLFYVHADHLGRPQKITDSSRAIAWDGVFAPFGEIHAITGGIVNVLMFPGQIYDPETGLSQNWHRDYDANIGRYLESDPIGLEGGFNTYAYVGGNPINTIDPTGEFGFGGAIAGAGLELGIQAFKNYLNGCDLFDIMNYDWEDVALSAAVGFVSPGSLAVGRRFVTTRGATRTLSRQLSATRSARRAATLQRRINRQWWDFGELMGWQLGWQGSKALGKYLNGDVDRGYTCGNRDARIS